MLPLSVQVPASVVLLAGGLIACFAGYRLFRFVLGVYGFILGAIVGASMVGAGQAWAVAAGAVAGGAVGALVLVAGYFVAVALIGAGIAALAVHLAWQPFGGDPHPVALIGAAALGAFGAMSFQRHVITVGTAFGGAWTALVGAAALMTGGGSHATSAGDIWVVYPRTAGPEAIWVYVSWVVISLAGIYVQLKSGGKKKRK